jgi:hypothetical protein
MAKRPQNLPAFNRAELEAINNRLIVANTPNPTRQAIMASLNAAANGRAETPEAGIASLPTERRQLAEKSVQETASAFSFTYNFQVPFDEQQELNEALERAQAEGKDSISWGVVVGLLYFFLYPREAEKPLYDSILSAYVAAWQNAVKEQAARYGCASARIGNPPRDSMAQLKEWAKRDSDSIVKTYDREAQSTLRKLYDSNPLGNTAYYLNAMSEWARTRQQQKNLTIGLNNIQGGYQLGLQDFHIHNKLQTKYRFVGSAPVCPICMRLFSMGHVDAQTMFSNPAPLHPNCSHYWESVNTYEIGCKQIWTGV